MSESLSSQILFHFQNFQGYIQHNESDRVDNLDLILSYIMIWHLDDLIADPAVIPVYLMSKYARG